MYDAVIRELWEIKDAIAREHGHDIEALARALRKRARPEGQNVVNLEGEPTPETHDAT